MKLLCIPLVAALALPAPPVAAAIVGAPALPLAVPGAPQAAAGDGPSGELRLFLWGDLGTALDDAEAVLSGDPARFGRDNGPAGPIPLGSGPAADPSLR